MIYLLASSLSWKFFPSFLSVGMSVYKTRFVSTIISWFLPVPMVLQKPRVNPITQITPLHGFSSTRCAPATIWTCSSQLSSGSMLSPCPWSTTINLRYFLPVVRVSALVDIPLRKWTHRLCNCKQCYSKFNSLLSHFMALHNICWLGSWCLCLFVVPHFDYIIAVSI